MSFDLTNKNIQDTFQNLLQRTGSDNRLYDLTGNEIGDLRISGSLTAQQYIVSSSVTNITTQELSGSTIFGNSSDDTHLFTGNITSSGNISASGVGDFASLDINGDVDILDGLTVTGDDGSGITMKANEPIIALNPNGSATARIGYTEDSIRLNNSSLSFSTVGHLVVSSSGLLTANALVGVGVEKPASTLDVGGNINTTSHITASGNISASGLTHTFGGTIETNTINASTIGASTTDVTFRGDNITITADGAGDIKFKEALTEVMRYDGGLDAFGIGTTTPSSKLTVAGDISASGTIFANSGSFNYITASIIDVDGDTIRFGGEPLTKANIQTLKEGRSLKPLRPGKSKPDIDADSGNFIGDITASGDIRKTQTLQMTNSSSVINTFNTGSIRSSKYMLQVISASNYQVSEMLVLHNDGATLNTEYAQLNSGVNLVNFTTEVNNSNVELIASSSFISCSVKFERTIIPT